MSKSAGGRMTTFLLLHCPVLLSTQPSRDTSLGSGLWWDPHSHGESKGNSGQCRLLVLPGDSTWNSCQGPDIIWYIDQAEASRKHLSTEGNWLLGSKIQKHNCRMCCLLKTMTDDTESLRSSVKPKGAGQNLSPHCLSPEMPRHCPSEASLLRW